MATKPTTKAETKVPAERMAPKPVRGCPARTAATEEKTSGAPLPRARRVTAAMLGERRRWDWRVVTTVENWDWAVLTRR